MSKPADMRQAMREQASPSPLPSTSSRSEAEKAKNNPQPGRQGKVVVSGWFPPEVKKQLKVIAATDETTLQNLIAEALNDLFAKRGKPEIAPMN
jgi:hypothetical protein